MHSDGISLRGVLVRRWKSAVAGGGLLALAMFGFSGNAHALTCTSKASGNWNAAATWAGCGAGTPGTADTAVISTHNITVNISTTIATLTFNAGGTNYSVTMAAGSSMTVTGNVTINQPTTTGITNGWYINSATAIVNGLISFAGVSTANRRSTVTIDSGMLRVSTITFAGTTPANKVIKMSGGAGTLFLSTAVTGANLATLNAGLSSVFSYSGNTNQTIATAWGAGGYNHLHIKPTVAGMTKTIAAGMLRVANLIVGDGVNAVTLTAATNNSVIFSSGNVTLENGGTFTKGASSTTFKPSGTVTWTDNNVTKQDMGWVKIEGGRATPLVNLGSSVKTSSVTIAASHELSANGSNTLEMTGIGTPFSNSGTFTYSTGIVRYTGNGATNIAALSGAGGANGYYDLEVKPSGATSHTLGTAASQTIAVNNKLTIGDGVNAGGASGATNNPVILVSSSVIINPATTFTAANSSMTVGSNWVNNSTFTANASTIIFNGAAIQQLTGNTTFYGMKAVTSGATLQFAVGTTQYITSMVEFRNLSLRSNGANGTTWYFCYTGSSQTLSNVQVIDSNASPNGGTIMDAGALIPTSTDLGNNTNWQFTPTDVGSRYWVAPSAGNWNTANNWSTGSGGLPYGGVPLATHTVVFDNGSTSTCTVNVNVTISTLTVGGFSAQLMTAGFDLTVTSTFTQTSGSVVLGTSVVTLQGSFIRTGGSFDRGSSTISFTGGNVQSLTPGGTSFHHVVINKSGGSLSLTSTMSVAGSFTNTAGTFSTGASSVSFIATGPQTIRSNAQAFTHLIFDGAGGSWSLSDPLTVSSNVTLLNGTFNLGSSTMSLGGNWTKSGGSFNAGASTVTFIGPVNQSLTSGGGSFFNLQNNKSANSLLLVDALDVDGIFTNTLGTLNTSSQSVTVGGNWNWVSGLYNGAASTVTFNSPTSSTLSGQTTFYALRAVTPNTTLYFTAGATQHFTNMIDLENVNLRSTTDGLFWHMRLAGSSQTVLNMDVQDSNAWSGNMILPDSVSIDSGNNKNWAFGDVRYWASAATANWNLTTSWSRSSGGSSGASVPSSTHTVIFDGANGKNGQANVNVAVNIASLTVAGYTGTLNTQGYDITVASGVALTSGILTLTTNTFSLGGDLLKTSGNTFNTSRSTLTLTAAQNQSLNIGAAALYNLNVGKTGGIASLTQHLSLNGDLRISGGTLDTTVSNFAITVSSFVDIAGGALNLNASTMSVNRHWTKTGGTFIAGTSTVSFIGGNAQTLTPGGTDFYHLVINKNAGTALTLSGALNIDGDFTHTLGTFLTQNNAIAIASGCTLNGGVQTLGTSSVTVGGDFIRTGGTFDMGASTFVFTGALNQSINAGATSFFNIQIMKSGGTATLAGPLLSSGTLTISSGTFDTGSSQSITVSSHVVINGVTAVFNLNNSTISLQRDWTETAGNVVPGGSTVTFTGGNTQNITTNNDNFFHLTVNKTAGFASVVQDALDVDGVFTITAGTMNANGKVMTVGRNWNNAGAGIFIGAGSTVTFDSATTQTLSGPTSFYILRAVTPNTTLYFTAGSTNYVTSGLEFKNVTLRSTTDNATWFFKYSGSSQTINAVTVKDSNANFGSTLFPDTQSSDQGNNRNWAFGGINRRYWVSAGAANWSQTTAWSYTSGGISGAPVPASTDTVVFDGAGGSNGQANVNVVVNIASLTIAGYSGTLNTQGFDITISSALTQTSGTITLTTNTVSIGGDFIRASAAAFNAAASTITLTGSLNQTINLAGATLFTLNVNKTGGTATLAAALTSTGSFTLAGGTFDTGAGNWSVTVTSHVSINGGTFNLNNSTMSVWRNWTHTAGTLNPGGSTVTFMGGNSQTLLSNTTAFSNLAINKSPGTSVMLQDDLDTNNIFTISGGTLNANGKAITVGGDWRSTLGTGFIGAYSTVTFNSATSATLQGATTFYAFRSLTPNTTLYFTAGTTQYVTSLVDLENIYLRSTSDNATWYFQYNGSSQTLVNLAVQDSNASMGTFMQTYPPSLNNGNNTNWDFGAPSAITNLTALISATGGSINLSWTAPGEDSLTGTLVNSTYTIQYTTDTVFATGNGWTPDSDPYPYVYRTIIATTNVNPGALQQKAITGLIDGGTYYFRIWTKDIHANTSAISNGATNYAQSTVLSIDLSTDTLTLTGTINLNTTLVISTGIVATNNGNVTETFEFHATTATAGTPWALAASTTTDRLVLWSIANATEPLETAFGDNDKLNSASYTRCTGGQITNGGDTCVSVPPGESRTIWFKLAMPNVTTTGASQQIRITGKATVPD